MEKATTEDGYGWTTELKLYSNLDLVIMKENKKSKETRYYIWLKSKEVEKILELHKKILSKKKKKKQ